MNKKITSLKSVVKSQKQKISSNCEEMLLKTFSEVPQALTRRMIMCKNHGKRFKYSEETISFALTLQFYSSKAYDYARKIFNFNLPHQAKIRKWYGKVSAEPGFTKPAFAALNYKVIEAEKLGSKVVLFDSENNAISWKYIVYLQKLQEDEGLRFGNKLRRVHINWRQQKLKVNLAAQAISSSVANAIEFCCKDLKLMQFQGDATVKFIRIFDRLFDILNSRNPFAKGYKSALKMSNKHIWDKFLDEAYDYISNLQDSSHRLLHTTRKTGFIGFLVAIKSIKQVKMFCKVIFISETCKLEGFGLSTIHDNLKRLETIQSFSDRKHPGCPTSWTKEKKAELTGLVNNRKGVSQKKRGIKFGVNQSTIGRQLKKMNIKYKKREKTPKYAIEQQIKAKKRSRKLVN
ncbi:uncharacterized protein LOC136078563 [Hydra vulgaris]|uniref:Uncharacterized protein LOC136078563 n=1 Tax=Hydra vulgaris TaxID=6087 RepID=A0ABM4BMV4_HYDVU